MLELLRTNDIVLLSLIEAIFKDQDIGYFIADGFMSAIEGSTGFMQRRVMVQQAHAQRARRALSDAGLAAEITNK